MTAPDNERPSTEDVRVSDEAVADSFHEHAVRRAAHALRPYVALLDTGAAADSALSASGYPQLLEEAERECVRLAGERDELAWAESEVRGERDHLRERVAELEAELEQMRRLYFGLRSDAESLEAENTRLREALTFIAEMPDRGSLEYLKYLNDAALHAAVEVARAALAHASSVEPSDAQGNVAPHYWNGRHGYATGGNVPHPSDTKGSPRACEASTMQPKETE